MAHLADLQAWRRFRRAYLRAYPLCVLCEVDGRRRIATQVDQVPAITAGGAWGAWEHLHALCDRHYVTQALMGERS